MTPRLSFQASFDIVGSTKVIEIGKGLELGPKPGLDEVSRISIQLLIPLKIWVCGAGIYIKLYFKIFCCGGI